MPLVLSPSFDDNTREQIEAHIADVQSKRMLATMEYHAGKHAKLSHESDKIQARVARQYELLGKELNVLEKAENKVIDRLAGLEHLKNELGLIMDMKEMHPVDTETED